LASQSASGALWASECQKRYRTVHEEIPHRCAFRAINLPDPIGENVLSEIPLFSVYCVSPSLLKLAKDLRDCEIKTVDGISFAPIAVGQSLSEFVRKEPTCRPFDDVTKSLQVDVV
jgi:hypothetical protein